MSTPKNCATIVRTQAGWLNMEYRVGGNIETLKRLHRRKLSRHHRKRHLA